MVDRRLAYLCGSDIPMDTAAVIVHQPRIGEIAMIGEKPFFHGVQFLIVDKEQDIKQKLTILKDISNFTLFITVMNAHEQKEQREQVIEALKLFLPNYSITFTPMSILLVDKKSKESTMIDENGFAEFQTLVKEILCLNRNENQQNEYNPQSEKAKEIARKLMRGRQIAAKQKGETNASVYGQYMSSLAVLLGKSLGEISKFTPYQLYDLMERSMLKTDWDIDIKARLAGGKPDKRPENWMKNIH